MIVRRLTHARCVMEKSVESATIEGAPSNNVLMKHVNLWQEMKQLVLWKNAACWKQALVQQQIWTKHLPSRETSY